MTSDSLIQCLHVLQKRVQEMNELVRHTKNAQEREMMVTASFNYTSGYIDGMESALQHFIRPGEGVIVTLPDDKAKEILRTQKGGV